MSADTIVVAVGDAAALAAAAFAFLALGQARAAVREARRERHEAEHARLTRRVEWAGEMIEQIDRLAWEDQRVTPPADSWKRGRTLLAQGFVGLAGRLPQTAKLVGSSDVYQVRSNAMLAREEVGRELERLAKEQSGWPGPRTRRGFSLCGLSSERKAFHEVADLGDAVPRRGRRADCAPPCAGRLQEGAPANPR